MIGNITNLILYSQVLSGTTTTFTFEMDKPSGDIGGYILYLSLDGIDYTEELFRVDYNHYRVSDISTTNYTYEEGSKVYFEYSETSSITDGRLLYFSFRAISEYNELSDYTAAITAYTSPSQPTGLSTIYDGYTVNLSWNAISTDDGINSEFSNYNIYRKRIAEVSGPTIDEDYKITDDLLELGKAVWVIDDIYKTQWFGLVTTAGEFTISDSNKITLASDTSTEYTIPTGSLRLLVEGDATLIGQTTSTTFSDTAYTPDIYYIYTISSLGTTGRESEQIKTPQYTIDVENAFPYLRSPGNSNNTILQQTYWKTLRDVLIDANYYNKTKFSIPHFKDEVYNLKGYIGISNCRLDIFINDIYYTTTSTGAYGEFDVNYQFNKGTTLISFQARDQYNIKFSRKSHNYSITAVNMYAWFSSLGSEYEVVDTELAAIKSDVNIENCRYNSFEDIYSPFIEMYKIGDEGDTVFRALATAAFQAFEYSAYDESLIKVLDAFQENLDEFDHYEIYFNDRIYGTQRTQYTFTMTSTGVTRGDYYYGVSACQNSGSETPVSQLRVDRRWWPDPLGGSNILMWDYVPHADFYKIYRGSSFSNLYYMTSTGYNFFVDIGEISTNPTLRPITYNYTDIERPANLKLYYRYGVNNIYLRKKQPNSLFIFLYGKNNSEIQDYNIERLLALFSKLIPPELLYSVVFANNSKVVIYPEGREVEFVVTVNYGYYDISYYYHPSIAESEEEVYV